MRNIGLGDGSNMAGVPCVDAAVAKSGLEVLLLWGNRRLAVKTLGKQAPHNPSTLRGATRFVVEFLLPHTALQHLLTSRSEDYPLRLEEYHSQRDLPSDFD